MLKIIENKFVLLLSFVSSIRMLGLFMLLPVLPVYAKHLEGANSILIGLALGIYGFPQALLQIPAGKLSDRIGRKPVIISGLLIFCNRLRSCSIISQHYRSYYRAFFFKEWELYLHLSQLF